MSLSQIISILVIIVITLWKICNVACALSVPGSSYEDGNRSYLILHSVSWCYANGHISDTTVMTWGNTQLLTFTSLPRHTDVYVTQAALRYAKIKYDKELLVRNAPRSHTVDCDVRFVRERSKGVIRLSHGSQRYEVDNIKQDINRFVKNVSHHNEYIQTCEQQRKSTR